MAVFGLPGGYEWVVIGLAVVFLFAPGVLVFWLGFLTGRRAAASSGPDAAPEAVAVSGTVAGAGAAEAPVAEAGATAAQAAPASAPGQPAEGAGEVPVGEGASDD